MHGLPYGGVGQSGFGSYHGKYSFELFSHQKVCALSLRESASARASHLLVLFHPVEILLNSTSFFPPEQTYMVRPKGLEFLNSGMNGRKLRIAFHCNSPEQPRLRAFSYVGYFFRWCSYGISSPQFATRRTRTRRAGHTLCSFQNWRTTTSCGGCDEQRPTVTF